MTRFTMRPTTPKLPISSTDLHGKAIADTVQQSNSQIDLICFSHLRWDFVYQRPQHLISRCSRQRRVFYWEEPVFVAEGKEGLILRERGNDLIIAVPHLPHGLTPDQVESAQREMLDCFMIEQKIQNYVCWYYTPMSLTFSDHLNPLAVIYDCMDELSA